MKVPGTFWLGKRLAVVAFLGVLLISGWVLGPRIIQLNEGADPFAEVGRFFGAALSPSLADENPSLPQYARPFLLRLGESLLRTFRYALIAISLAVPAGLVLGFLASSAWWPGGMRYGKAPVGRTIMRGMLRLLRWVCRFLITLGRSIHELVWALFFLSALGDAPIAACSALALPFAGTLGKVFSELIDEQSQDSRSTLMATGASPLQAFVSALLPSAVPEMLTYTVYRFECALRSSAVLGFIGVETVGLGIRQSYESLYYGEVWTQLYALVIVVVGVDILGARLRERLNRGATRKAVPELSKLELGRSEARLRRTAPRDWIVRGGLLAGMMLVLISWTNGRELGINMAAEQRDARIGRFLTKLTPAPARPENSTASGSERVEALEGKGKEVKDWAVDLWSRNGAEALLNTVAIASSAIVLAAVGAALLLPVGSRALARGEPFGVLGAASRWVHWWWSGVGFVTRSLFILARAVPEYVYAFLLVGLLGPSAWPLVFALALHNLGILGRLWGEVMENQRPEVPRHWIQSGSGRVQSYCGSLAPLSFNRFLLFFFYRWETCIREATILGMLGISSLGYYVSIAHNWLRYDEMLFYVLLGVAVVFAGDVLSDWMRRKLRGEIASS